jgi:FKBP-type peptidyl-prolyl cis-trans isomerase (trigger factor)
MDDSVKNSELKRQIKSLESDRNRLIDQLSERTVTRERSRLIHSEVSNISRQIDQLFKEKERIIDLVLDSAMHVKKTSSQLS